MIFCVLSISECVWCWSCFFSWGVLECKNVACMFSLVLCCLLMFLMLKHSACSCLRTSGCLLTQALGFFFFGVGISNFVDHRRLTYHPFLADQLFNYIKHYWLIDSSFIIYITKYWIHSHALLQYYCLWMVCICYMHSKLTSQWLSISIFTSLFLSIKHRTCINWQLDNSIWNDI